MRQKMWEVAQWLALQTIVLLIERLVFGVCLWAPKIHWGERRWRSAKGKSPCSPPPPGSLNRKYTKFCMRVEREDAHCSEVLDEYSMDYTSLRGGGGIALKLRHNGAKVEI